MTSKKRLAILVVDDDKDTNEMVSYCLEASGMVVRAAKSVAEALVILETWPAGCILTDVAVPGEDGFALLAHVRANPATHAIPLIALTGYGGETQTRALDAGFHMFITKPVDLTSLPATVEGVVDGARRERCIEGTRTHVGDDASGTMARRLAKQWRDVIEPVLRRARQSLELRGFLVTLTAPTEATEGVFDVRGPPKCGWWTPGFRLFPHDSGRCVRMSATFGEITASFSITLEYQPEELTSAVIETLVGRLVDEGFVDPGTAVPRNLFDVVTRSLTSAPRR